MDDSVDLIDPFDDCEWLPARELFRRIGFEPLAPDKVDDFQLSGRLWELIYALAGRRFYIHSTNHLSDRELYGLLWRWMAEDTAVIPPEAEAEWNCHIDLTELDPANQTQLYLRYYADEKRREEWALDFPEDKIPPHEPTPFDRDRWLPEPPVPSPIINEVSFPSEEDLAESDGTEAYGTDGWKTDNAEQKMRDEMAAITGGELPYAWQRPVNKIKQSISLMPPAELTDETLPAKLWELLHNLACHGFYVLNSNHLSDRELYSEHWHHGIRDESCLPGKCRTGGWFHDTIGSGSEEDTQLWLRFYASDEETAKHRKDWPKISVPEKETPPFNRDWRLPKGPF